MKSNTKSSITLPPEELAIVNYLLKKLKAKSKVEIVRRGLHLLKQQYEADLIREQFREDALMVKEANKYEVQELDHLSAENLDED